jgi:cysteine synthase A
VGGSTGTNIWGAFGLIAEMIAAGRTGSVVTLLCDGGDRYSQTYFDDTWVAGQGMNLDEPTAALEQFIRTGVF